MDYKTIAEHNGKCTFPMPVGWVGQCPDCGWNPSESNENYDYTEGGMW